jgi:hypothetical protein
LVPDSKARAYFGPLNSNVIPIECTRANGQSHDWEKREAWKNIRMHACVCVGICGDMRGYAGCGWGGWREGLGYGRTEARKHVSGGFPGL